MSEQTEICEVCKQGTKDIGPLYRKNPRDGTPAIWRHNHCFDAEPVRVDSQEVSV